MFIINDLRSRAAWAFSVACFLSVPPLATHAQDYRTDAVRICVQKEGEVSGDCVDLDAMSMRLEGALPRDGAPARKGELFVQLDAAGYNRFLAMARSGETPQQVRICIVDGANICPPEPFEFIAICITTNMLAGETCPTPVDTDETAAILHLRSGG